MAAAIEEQAFQLAADLLDLEEVDLPGIRPGAGDVPPTDIRVLLGRQGDDCRHRDRTQDKT